jgi:hypothetical protein
MIAYEELEKALARWKARRPGATGANVVTSPPMNEASEATPMADLERTSMGERADAVPAGVGEYDPAADQSTGEVVIGDSGLVGSAVDDDRTNHN